MSAKGRKSSLSALMTSLLYQRVHEIRLNASFIPGNTARVDRKPCRPADRMLVVPDRFRAPPGSLSSIGTDCRCCLSAYAATNGEGFRPRRGMPARQSVASTLSFRAHAASRHPFTGRHAAWQGDIRRNLSGRRPISHGKRFARRQRPVDRGPAVGLQIAIGRRKMPTAHEPAMGRQR